MLKEQEDKIVVTSSLWRSILLIIGSLIMTIGCLYASTAWDAWIFEKIIAIIAIIFFGLGTIYLIYRTIAKKELIIIDKNGITDNSSAVSFWFIPWNDICNIEITDVKNEKFITLSLNNEDKYLEGTSKVKKTLALTNRSLGYGMVNITLVGTGVDVYEFYQKIIEYIKLKKLNIHIWPKEEQTSII